ncbi:DUF1015 domain-containing protein [Bernardetia sp.]|uniref:DUF1015 domain-containing protein n=1 Tax=Bernardetia sp. TaxID=1937974 RepID=UPI0025C5B849|nr:DUF1015 domain-containing protein [Bernardetia sp.]
MAEIRPFRAWRYNASLTSQIQDFTSPLFDVISQKQRDKLYQNPLNSIHLSVPLGQSPADDARETLEKWIAEGTITQDDKPAVYVYYQYFVLPARISKKKEYCRKGFITMIKAYDWEENIILRHENTIPAAVNDRIELLEKTALNVSPTHGLYGDEKFELEKYMDEAIKNPIYETEDYQGVREVFAKIDDPKIVEKFVEKVKDKEIILADGHHRYESSMVYRQKKKEENPNHTGNELYNFHLMYLTNSYSNDLRILPTHRLLTDLEISEEEIVEKLEEDFIVKSVENSSDLNEMIWGKKWAFGLIFSENAYKISLKPEKWETLAWKFPESVKNLDLTVLHYFFIEKIIGIKGKDQRKSTNIQFERNFTDCVTKVIKGEADLALITNAVTMPEVKEVCKSGYTMPQKSTYFYPKVICGFCFASVEE